MVASLDRRTKITEQGGPPTLEFQILWQALRTELDRLATAAASRVIPFREMDATGNAEVADYLLLVDATAGAVTVNLPPAVDAYGALLVVKKVDASGNAVTLDADGSETIDGATTTALAAQYDKVSVACDGVTWWKV
jgi:hypothetical protein